jgi:hypothetical protein
MRGVALDQIVQVLDGLESRPIAIARERCSQGLLLAMFSLAGISFTNGPYLDRVEVPT